MQSKNYNLIPLSIDKELKSVQIGTAGGYIRLLEAPAAAKVYIHLNESNADPIPLKVYHAIEATNIERIFVSCNAIPGEKITLVQANKTQDFKMVTPASDVNLAALGSYESLALSQLDKIINPYGIPIVTVLNDSSDTYTTIFSKTLDCDKIEITITSSRNNKNGLYMPSYTCDAIIESNCFLCANAAYDTDNRGWQSIFKASIEKSKNKKLEIKNITYDGISTTSIIIKEYYLK